MSLFLETSDLWCDMLQLTGTSPLDVMCVHLDLEFLRAGACWH